MNLKHLRKLVKSNGNTHAHVKHKRLKQGFHSTQRTQRNGRNGHNATDVAGVTIASNRCVSYVSCVCSVLFAIIAFIAYVTYLSWSEIPLNWGVEPNLTSATFNTLICRSQKLKTLLHLLILSVYSCIV